MNTLLILNDPPYGTERCFNALRLAHTLLKKEPEATVTVFLMADAVVAARKGQKTPDGYYNMERMLKRVLAKGMDARAALQELAQNVGAQAVGAIDEFTGFLQRLAHADVAQQLLKGLDLTPTRSSPAACPRCRTPRARYPAPR